MSRRRAASDSTAPSAGRWASARLPLGVFAAALMLRLVYLVESADYPAFAVPIIDALDYDTAARQLLGGGGFSRQFFWQPFFYPLWLAAAYAVTGGSLVATKVLQVGLGAATCSLTSILGRRLGGPRVGLLAGLITAAYGPLIAYEAEPLGTGWATFWAVVLLLLFTRPPTGRRAAALGACGALAVLTRAEFLPFLVIAAAAQLAALTRRGERGAAARAGAAGAAGFLAVTLPVAVLNTRVTGHFGFLPYAGGINLYVGNHPDRTLVATAVGDDWKRIRRLPLAAGLTAPYDAQRYFYHQTRTYIAGDPLGFLARLGDKALQFVSSREIPRDVDVYELRRWSWIQRLLTWKVGGFGFPFGVLLPLAAVGLVAQRRCRPTPLWLFLTGYPLAVVLVFVAGRFRVPVVPVLAIAAAAGAIVLWQAWRERRWRRLAGAVAGGVLVAVLATVPGPFPLERDELRTATRLNLALGRTYAARGQVGLAQACFERDLAEHPDSARAHAELGLLLARQGRLDDALAHYAAALRLDAESAPTQFNCALALAEAGRLSEALPHFAEAVRLEPYVARYHAWYGRALAEAGRSAEARAAFERALALEPAEPEARRGLARLAGSSGDGR